MSEASNERVTQTKHDLIQNQDTGFNVTKCLPNKMSDTDSEPPAAAAA